MERKNAKMIITSLARMWLTRSIRPFEFTNQNDKKIDFINTDSLGLYIHIPFCSSICSFCPYCKELYNTDKCNKYVDALIQEINIVGKTMKAPKKITSVYFGGGTPALIVDRLEEILSIVRRYFIIDDGIGIELHPDNVNFETLSILKASGVTKISIGIQSFQSKFLSILGRKKLPDYSKMSEALKTVPFETVSMDFIFALPNQNISDIKSDIETAISIGANHFALYPFIKFDFTKNQTSIAAKSRKHKLMDELANYCHLKGYHRDSIWTFSKNSSARYSSMTRENYLGFGCSAVTLLYDSFKINTFSIDEYIVQVECNKLPTSLTLRFSKRQRMVYYLFWKFYSMSVSASEFRKFFDTSLKKAYGIELSVGLLLNLIKKDKDIYTLTNKGAFYFHYFENYFTLSYIEKMWGQMRVIAFPEKMKL